MKLIYLMFFISTLSSCRNAEPATYYIPKNFNGVVAVIYSQTNERQETKEQRIFRIPESGILFTKNSFSDGWRKDMFLMTSDKGFDTLRTYLPSKDSTGKKFDKSYYEMYTDDSNEIAINFRQIVNPTFNKFDTYGNKTHSCTFQYELITIGKAKTLNDSTGKEFIKTLDKLLQDSLCH